MEVLIVVVLILLFSSVTMLSITRFTVSAEASRIINNLQLLKSAVFRWYKDNTDKIQSDGRIKIGTETAPIQEFGDSKIGLSKYIDGREGINTASGANKNLAEGTYGVNSARTVINDTQDRWTWYVGYHFAKGEDEIKESVRDKIASMKGFHFTDNWPKDSKKDIGNYIWLLVFSYSKK